MGNYAIYPRDEVNVSYSFLMNSKQHFAITFIFESHILQSFNILIQFLAFVFITLILKR